jgi:hypothetical protein
LFPYEYEFYLAGIAARTSYSTQTGVVVVVANVVGSDDVSQLLLPTGLMFISHTIYECGAPVKSYWQGKSKNSRKTCPRATLFTTNTTWSGPGAKLGLRCERTVTNRLSHCMA